MLLDAHTPRRRGFTLTEIAIVLGLVGLLLGGIWTAASSVMRGQMIAKAAQQNMQIVSNFRKLFTQRGLDLNEYCDLTCVGIESGFFPSELASGASCTLLSAAVPACPTYNVIYPATAFGGISYVGVSTKVNPDSIIMDYRNIPIAYCTSFILALIQSSDSWSVELNGNPGYSYNQYGGGAAVWTPTDVAGQCATAAGVGNKFDTQVWYTVK